MILLLVEVEQLTRAVGSHDSSRLVGGRGSTTDEFTKIYGWTHVQTGRPPLHEEPLDLRRLMSWPCLFVPYVAGF